MGERKETYLGDGLYASFDGWCIWLRAPREDGDHRVALEPPVFAALISYEKHLGRGPDEPTDKAETS